MLRVAKKHIMLSAIMLNVIMLSVIILNVVAPWVLLNLPMINDFSQNSIDSKGLFYIFYTLGKA
jgi:hypothetical protein